MCDMHSAAEDCHSTPYADEWPSDGLHIRGREIQGQSKGWTSHRRQSCGWSSRV